METIIGDFVGTTIGIPFPDSLLRTRQRTERQPYSSLSNTRKTLGLSVGPFSLFVVLGSLS